MLCLLCVLVASQVNASSIMMAAASLSSVYVCLFNIVQASSYVEPE